MEGRDFGLRFSQPAVEWGQVDWSSYLGDPPTSEQAGQIPIQAPSPPLSPLPLCRQHGSWEEDAGLGKRSCRHAVWIGSRMKHT